MKISVVGSINMDMTVTVERIPKKGETLMGSNIHYMPGGKGANQAIAMAKLGAKVEMFGCIGNDSAGETLIKNLKDAGIETAHIKSIDCVPTGVAMITVGENDNTIVVSPGANDYVDVTYVDEIKEELLKSEIVLLQHEIRLETVSYIINMCYEHGVKVILNPAPAARMPEDIVKKVTYLTPNEHEAEILFGVENTMEELLVQYPGKLIITRGSQGVCVCSEEGDILRIHARKTKIVDTTGAGDTLNGAFAVQIANKKSVIEALQFANVAASLSIEKFGAQDGMPTYSEVLHELGEK